MLIAMLTSRGAARVLDGAEGQCFPVHHAYRRTDGQWVISVADFLQTREGLLPFQSWTLGDGDYSLHEALYDGAGWTYRPAAASALTWLDTPRSAREYVERFPLFVQPYVDRIYADGFADGSEAAAGEAE